MSSEVLSISPYFIGSSTVPVEETSSIGPTGKAIKNARYLNNAPFYYDAAKKAIDEIRGHVFQNRTNDITQFSFLGGTALEKAMKEKTPRLLSVVKEIDKSLIDSKCFQRAVENVFDCRIAANTAGKLTLTAAEETLKTKTARLVADTLGTTTRLGLGVSCLVEAPELYHAYQNNKDGNWEFGKQTLRSSARITASTLAFGIIAHLGKIKAPAKFRVLASIGGAVLGSILATKATDKVLDKTIGKSIESQKRAALETIEKMKEQRLAQIEEVKRLEEKRFEKLEKINT